MKKCLTCVPFAVFVLFAATAAYSQQTEPRRYSSALYLHVPADKESQFVDFYKSGAGMKAMQARMKADPQISAISVRRAVYANPLPRANYVIMTGMTGAPVDPDPAKRDELYRSATGMNYATYIVQARSMSEVVGQSLAHVHDATPDFRVTEGDVVIARRFKTAEGKTSDLYASNRDFRLPIMTERVKAGAIKGWTFAHFALAQGSSLPFDATETTIHKDMASALDGQVGGGNEAMTRFMKLFPGKSFTQYQDSRRELAKLIRTDIYRVVAAVQR